MAELAYSYRSKVFVVHNGNERVVGIDNTVPSLNLFLNLRTSTKRPLYFPEFSVNGGLRITGFKLIGEISPTIHHHKDSIHHPKIPLLVNAL